MIKRFNSILIFFLFIAVLAGLSACDNGSHHSGRSDAKTTETSLTFLESSTGLPSLGQWRQGLAFYDMNQDGHLDILAPPPRKAPENGRKPFLWLGNGKGEWQSAPLSVPMDVPYDYGDIEGGDFNGDGIPDLALAIHFVGLKGLKGQGESTYTTFSQGLPAREDFATRALTSADFNNDGIPDIAAASEGRFTKENTGGKTGAMVCLGSQSEWKCRLIGDEKEISGLFADQIITGDVNGDGNADIGIASLQHRLDLIVWLGNGKGGFSPFNQGLLTPLHYRSVAFSDVNRDGRDDVIASVTGFGKDGIMALKVFLSGQDGFTEMGQGLPDREGYFSVATGDLNGDGVPEIVGGTASGGLKVFAQKDGIWRQAITPTLPQTGLMRIYNTYCVDLNRDGFDDIVVNYATEKNNAGGIRVFLSVPPPEK